MRFKPKTRPRFYQAQALKRAFQSGGRYGLFLKPGTGKTKIAIDFCAALFLQQKASVVLVVCQLTGWPVWESELLKHCAVPYRLVMLPRGSRSQVEALNLLEPDGTRLTFILINYEATWRIEGALVNLDPHVLICDEAHKIKNRSAKQSRCIHRLVQALDPYRLMLTGTPIANAPLDVFSQYMAIDDSVFGRRWAPFVNRYAIFYGYYNRKVKYKNLGDLRRRARTKATVLTKEECLDLPTRSYEHLTVRLDEKARKAYDEMDADFITFLDTNETATAAIKLTQMLRLSQLTGGFITAETGELRQVGSEKLDALETKLDELINAGEKVVVFARFRWEIDKIEELCSNNSWKSWKLYGYADAKLKREASYFYQRFQAHSGPAVFIAQTQAGSLSIELYAAAYAIFYSFDYSLITWEQCHDRIHRSGQTRKVTYYYLIADQTLDIDIWNALHYKKGVATLLENNPDKAVLMEG